VKIVIDHLRGSRRGQRQEFLAPPRLTLGRHPRSDVAFDAHRDLDSSSRHAELRQRDDGYVLCDTGSSNGTFIGGERVGEIALEAGRAIEAEFGAGGPLLRIWTGPDDQAPELPAGARWRGRRGVALAAVIAVVLVGVGVALAVLAGR
jgi:hypothetical protein